MSPHTHPIEKIAIRATRWVGSPASLVVHTILFIAAFVLAIFGVAIDTILLVLTTIVSLEAIYLSIFIQMSVNRQARRLHAVSKDIDEIQKDVDEIQEDIEEIAEDVEEISEDVEGIERDVDEIQKDVDEIQEDLEEDQKREESERAVEAKELASIERIESLIGKLSKELEEFRKK